MKNVVGSQEAEKKKSKMQNFRKTEKNRDNLEVAVKPQLTKR